MEKAGRGGDGAPRGPVLHIVVVGFHHKKGCQVRKEPAPAPRRAARSSLQRPRPVAAELGSSAQLLTLAPAAAHPHTPCFLLPCTLHFEQRRSCVSVCWGW